MSKSYRYLLYDVFTDHLFGGNQLAVVVDARGLSSETMQSVAKELNLSETTFVLPAESPDTDTRMRIFMPNTELTMGGHPTIGSTFALARIGVIPPGRERFVFGLGVGPTPVSLTWRDANLTFAWMTLLNPTFGEPISDPGGAAAMLSLPRAAVAGTGLPVQVISCGVGFLFVPLTTRTAVDHAMIDLTAYEEFFRSAKIEAHGVFLFSTEPRGERATLYSRMFAPDYGLVEDPATGSASGPVGCYLVAQKIVPAEKAGSMVSLQGVKMGRPSHVHIAIGTDNGAITSVRVGGEAVLAGEGTLYI